MSKLLKTRGFVSLPLIIGGAIIAAGLIGGAIYELKTHNPNLSVNNKNSLLASTVDLIQGAELNQIKFSAIGQDVTLREIAFKLTSDGSNLQNQTVTLHDFAGNQIGQIYFTGGRLVATTSLSNFVILEDGGPSTNNLRVKGTIVSGSSVKIDYVSSKGTGHFSGNTIWNSNLGATAVMFNTLTELNRINFLANGQQVKLTDVTLKLDSGSPSNLKDQNVSLYFNNNPVGQAFFTAGNLVSTSTLVGQNMVPTGGASATLIIKGITNSPSVNVKYVASKAIGYSSGNTILDSSLGATAITFTTIIPTCSSFTYSDWGTCESSGNQARGVTSISPPGCSGGSPITSQSCNYVAPTLACASFTYSDWSVCQSNSTQYRSVTASGPSGCTGGTPITTQMCTYSTTQSTTQTQQTHAVQPASSSAVIAPSASQTTVVSPSVTAAPSSNTSFLQQQINALIEMVNKLKTQLGIVNSDQQSVSPVATSQTSATSVAVPTNVSSGTILSSEEEPTIAVEQTELFSYIWNKDLYYGLTNDKDVEALQNVLVMESCYAGPVTGNFYRLTRAGVICFQKKYNFINIPGTGYVGTYTRKVLNELYSK